MHVERAFGLWAAAADLTRPLVAGVEAADSWATDAHKWLNVPYDCRLAIVADRQAHLGAMGVQASYLVQGGPVPDQFALVPEFSRRARGSRSMQRCGRSAGVEWPTSSSGAARTRGDSPTAMRISVSNWSTIEADVDASLAALRRIAIEATSVRPGMPAGLATRTPTQRG